MKLLRRTLFTLLAMLILGGIVLAKKISEGQEEIERSSRYYVPYTINQAANELARLQDSISAAAVEGAEVGLDTIELRASILKNRLNVLRNGESLYDLSSLDQGHQILARIGSLLDEIDRAGAAIAEPRLSIYIRAVIADILSDLISISGQSNTRAGVTVADNQASLSTLFRTLAGLVLLIVTIGLILGSINLHVSNRIIKELRHTAEAAEAANASKTQFLATMSHELRTPLNAIIGFSDMIDKQVFGPIGNEKYREYIADIHRSGESLLGLINDILDITKLDIGAFQIKTTTFHLAETLRSAIQVVSILASEKRIRIDTSGIADEVTVSADARATRQVALNLLANAIKFTGSGGLIEVRILSGRAPGRVAFQVIDNGRGMSADELGRIGQAFVQVGDSYQNKDQGSGLGLAICKAILAQMSGELEIESAVGKGTTATVTLPAEAG